MKVPFLKDNVLLTNIFSQSVVQLANYAIPLLVIPYVTRIFGPQIFGTACYAQNIAAYFTFLVNFGFGLAATQEVAISKDNQESLQSIFFTVVSVKSLLLLLSFAILFGLYFFVPQVHANFLLFVVAALFNIGCVLFPDWFYQGMERMALMSLFVFFIRLLGLVLVFAFVSSPDDVLYYLLALSLANIVVGLVAFVFVIRKYQLHFSLPKNIFKTTVVSKSVPAFLNAFFVNCNMLVGITLLGYYCSDYEVGIYAGAQKIITAVVMVASEPIVWSLYPRMSKRFAADKVDGLNYMWRCLAPITVFALVASLAVYFVSPFVVGLMLGEKFQQSVDLVCLLSPLVFLYTIATTLTVQGLFGLQLHKFAPFVGFMVFVSNCLLIFFLVPMCGIKGAAYAWMLVQIVEIALDMAFIGTHKPRKNTISC